MEGSDRDRVHVHPNYTHFTSNSGAANIPGEGSINFPYYGCYISCCLHYKQVALHLGRDGAKWTGESLVH